VTTLEPDPSTCPVRASELALDVLTDKLGVLSVIERAEAPRAWRIETFPNSIESLGAVNHLRGDASPKVTRRRYRGECPAVSDTHWDRTRQGPDGTELSVLIYNRQRRSIPMPPYLHAVPEGIRIGRVVRRVRCAGLCHCHLRRARTGDRRERANRSTATRSAQDGLHVEWCARQAWCSGKVGMWAFLRGGGRLADAAAAPPSPKQ